MTRILIVDDHRMFADAIALLLRSTGTMDEVRIAEAAEDALHLLSGWHADVVVLDVDLPGISGIAAIPSILERCPEARVIVVSAVRLPDIATRAVEAGAIGFIDKHRAADDMIEAVAAAAAGEIVLPKGGIRAVLGPVRADGPHEAYGLTTREIEVLQQLTDGRSTGETAERLFISKRTVQSHVQSAIDKMRVHSKLEAVLFALRAGLVRLESGGRGGMGP